MQSGFFFWHFVVEIDALFDFFEFLFGKIGVLLRFFDGVMVFFDKN
jgi:hypothetical protein